MGFEFPFGSLLERHSEIPAPNALEFKRKKNKVRNPKIIPIVEKASQRKEVENYSTQIKLIEAGISERIQSISSPSEAISKEEVYEIAKNKIEKGLFIDFLLAIRVFKIENDDFIRSLIVEKLNHELHEVLLALILKSVDPFIQKLVILKVFSEFDRERSQKALKVINLCGFKISEFPFILESLQTK